MKQTQNLRSLAEIADIRTGFTFREKVEESPDNGNAHSAQIKDARSEWERTNGNDLLISQLPLIHWEGKDKAFVEPGTVLLPARGAKGSGYFRASCLMADEPSSLPVVVSSQFLIITPKKEVLPEFLCWSLNQPAIQYHLTEGAGSQGSNIVMLNTKLAGELQLEIPSLKTQHKILHLNRLWEQEQQLTQALLKNRDIMLQGMFQQLLKETE